MSDKITPGELMNEVNALSRERDELRALVKELQDLSIEQQEEIRRLRVQVKQLREEIDGLRAALPCR